MNDQRYPWYKLSWMLADKLQQFEVSSARKDGYLIIDDTIIEKFGKSMQGIHKLKDPATGAYVLGYNVVNLLYTDGTLSYPLGFEYRIWDDDIPDAKEKTKRTQSPFLSSTLSVQNPERMVLL